MSLKELKVFNFTSILKWVIVVLSLVHCVQGQDLSDYDQINNPALRPLITQFVFSRLSNLTAAISRDIGSRASFCVKDPEADWDRAFNFSSNLDFLESCLVETEGDLGSRICTVAEMKFYFDSFFESSNPLFLEPNKNCNLTSQLSGCEPGWACSVGQNQEVDIQESENIPPRTQDCKPCCEGFFCPRGITCMMPCPLGSFCPRATLNETTGICEPYNYQASPGLPNHTCGGANIWSDVRSSREVFCSAGSFCPTTTTKSSCSSGHYCRMGSTSEKRCIKLTSCDPNTANQNMHAYGIMLIAALSLLLIIIYNCTDQILITRERRLAKSREAAARSARETAKARQRWKAAKDAAKKHASGFQEHLSGTFSRKKIARSPEQLKILDEANFEVNDDPYTPAQLSISDASLSSSAASKGKKMETRPLTQDIHEIEAEPEKWEGLSLEVEHSSSIESAHHMQRVKELNTDSKIFKYAYAQLEKEKALEQANKNLTFSGVVSMATTDEIKRRPLIEVSFKDLTLTLKAKKKHLLRSVTGNIKPGRITAVMGPSGAGKTTFLSALAGKAIGCRMTGSILVNGKSASIHSYKKVVGFVPQDDIVHGNLTVEENLWFHAKCRLPAGLAKAEKVLVVERVIESLGLQTVRDSLVGTVEKRGISGGQRKRVNVGLEMVMEPSLLILDEPTSGLDSASSQLLLRALRHEALEGVNVCMVVHQPRYLSNFGVLGYTTHIAVSLLCKISALRTFSLDKLHYWRESASGMSSLACFLAKDTIDHFNTAIKPVVYLSMFYFFTNPRSSFADNYIVLLCLVYCVTGIAYALAIFFQPSAAQLWSVLLPVVLTLIATRQKGNGALKVINNFSYPKWALEAFVIANAERYSGVWLITRCGSLMQNGYSLQNWGLCIFVLLLFGIVGRVIAYVGMVTFQKK
ncbi:ABC transporter G family member 24-like [Carica papaya]|uniref:ABC transporter G family member 24-like n=1 Tax=Carica papaya TaxID=3649 RepID=UPI000B8CA45E|nr:ABC transporter G family member 24-like [Carica papaya]